MPGRGLYGRLLDGLLMLVVTGLSLSVLLYVAFGEAKRGYEQVSIEKITAQGRFLQNSIENYLRQDLPLKQYAGFVTLATPLVEDESVDAIAVYDRTGRQLFIVVDKSNPTLPPPASAITRVEKRLEVEVGVTHYQVVLPLRTRFETVGSVVVMSPTKLVTNRVRARFLPLLFVAGGMSILFALLIVFGAPYLGRFATRWRQIGYATTFLVMAGYVVFTLTALYFDAVEGKVKASAVTLSQRLADIAEFKLDIRDIAGLENTFNEYRKLNPEVSEAALIVDDKIQVSSNGKDLGRPWVSNPRDFEYTLDLSRGADKGDSTLTVTVPRSIVYERVVRSVKNFAALFIAAAFMSSLFFQVASSLQRLRSSALAATPDITSGSSSGEALLVIIKPIFFLAVFLDSLTYSFLPRFMQEAAIASGISVGFASIPYTAYYLCFAISLIPAGNYADRFGPRPVIAVGLLLAAGSVLGLMLPFGIGGMTAMRALAGVGQGALFIGVQTFILAVTPPEKKTQGAAIIVFGFQGGMTSGMALGSLMVSFLHPEGIFMLAGAVGVATVLYTMCLVPRTAQKAPAKGGIRGTLARLGGDVKKTMSSGEFLKTIFCIGIPAKAILTGTITFALPLLLGQQKYRQEDIGQIIMLYGLAVVAASGFVSRLVDRTRNTESILFWGAVLSGGGLVLVGLMGSPMLGNDLLGTVAVVAGVVIVGIAHGFINAPVVTHVSHSHLASRIGITPVATTYRFLERFGHVAGPFLISQLFLIWGEGPQIVLWIGVATAALGMLFIAPGLPGRLRGMHAEPAE
jgi:MFS family permease